MIGRRGQGFAVSERAFLASKPLSLRAISAFVPRTDFLSGREPTPMDGLPSQEGMEGSTSVGIGERATNAGLAGSGRTGVSR